MRFKDKHVVVTGAAQGIGYGIAKQFVQEGANVSILDCQKKVYDSAKQLSQYGEKVAPYLIDITETPKALNCLKDAEKRKSIDVLVNNAGMSVSEKNILETTLADFDKVIGINLRSMFALSQQTIKYMMPRKQGAIVNIGSISSFLPELGYASYDISKAGVLMLTKQFALESAPYGIRVNCVCPGRINTGLLDELNITEEVNNDFVNRNIPMMRDGKVEEVAPAVLFLADNKLASYITGTFIMVDGGLTAGITPSVIDKKRNPFNF